LKHDEQHIDIRDRLRKLPKVKAKEGFENELMRRINLLETEKTPVRRSAGIFDLLFGKRSLAWIVPAMSLTVVAIVVIGVYFIFYNKGDVMKPQVSSNTTTEQTAAPVVPPSVTKTEETNPGKEIANDLDIGKSSRLEKKVEINRGFNETYSEPVPKVDAKGNVDELKGVEKSDRKVSEEVMQKSVTPGEKENGTERGKLDDKKKEMPKSIKEAEKKESIQPKKDNEGIIKSDVMEKTGRDANSKDAKSKDTTKEEKKKKSNKEKDLTKEILESLSKKIKDNQ